MAGRPQDDTEPNENTDIKAKAINVMIKILHRVMIKILHRLKTYVSTGFGLYIEPP
jgi:hypothetical protein